MGAWMLLILLKRLFQNLLFMTILCYCFTSAYAGDKPWLMLKASRFGIVSQLNEKETRLWAEEFDKYVSALHLLYSADDNNLSPLTILLFKDKKQFSPYIFSTESGQVKKVIGVFANFDDWSTIGLPGLKAYQQTRTTIFHEAVHWYLKSQNLNAPLWLEEGIAEVFSTFEIRNGKGRWGLPIQAHVDFLNYKGLQPTKDFLFATQDEALHKLDTYYPQAWAMVHYYLFGNSSKNRVKFNLFMSELGKKTTKEAFESAFEMTYEEFDRELQRYIHSGKYNIGEMDLSNTDTEMKIGPASNAAVQFALGRLAVAGGNYDLGIQHAEAVISNAPSRPEGYDLLAMALKNSENKTRLAEVLEKAISLNSSDSQIYFMKASMLMEEKWRTGFVMGGPLESDVAKQIADLFKKSILLRPNKKYAFEGYAMALLNMDTYEVEDKKILELGKQLYPLDGAILVGFAALARMDGDIVSFNQKIEESCNSSMQMSQNTKTILRGLQQYSYQQWLFDKVDPLMKEGKFEEAEALLAQHNSLPFISTEMRKVLKEMDAVLYSSKKLYNAELAMKAGRIDEASVILEDIEKDEKIPRQGKSAARRMMSYIEKTKKYLEEKKGMR
jgi:tetratricopeptide (TPR) repeat protein